MATKKRLYSTASSDFQTGRDDRVRTCGLIVPNDARYQTAPHPDNRSKYIMGLLKKQVVFSKKEIIVFRNKVTIICKD